MFFFRRIWFFIMICFLAASCGVVASENKELLFWCSNNNMEIKLCSAATGAWNRTHGDNTIHLQPIPEGQSSEEVILAAVVGKTTPDIYGNMWQGDVEDFARSGVLIALDTLKGFTDFIYQRCDSSVVKEIT